MSAGLLLLAALTEGTYLAPWEEDEPALHVPRRFSDGGPRMLLNVGVIVGGGIENVVPTSRFAGTVGAAGLGLYFGAGLQLDDRWGFGPEIGGGTSVFWSYGRGALVVDYTPADWVAVGVGPVAWIDGMSLRGCPKSGCTASNAEAVGGTLRLDFHPGVERTEGGRSAATIGIVADLGATVGEDAGGSFGTGFAWGVYLTLGYARY